jgi:hypothetical protein
MDTVIALALTAAWLALGALLAYHVFVAWRRVEPPPFFEVLQRHGLSVTQAEEAVGREALATAVRRCALCSQKKACARALAAVWRGHWPPACGANAEFLERVKGAAVQHA